MHLVHLHDLLLAVEARLVDGKARSCAGEDDLVLVLERDGRSLHQPLCGSVYHVDPDGTDVERHASWIVELFEEDTT